jgi:hypothetical protein
MNRREFIGGTIAGAVAAGLPACQCDCAEFPGEYTVEFSGVPDAPTILTIPAGAKLENISFGDDGVCSYIHDGRRTVITGRFEFYDVFSGEVAIREKSR